MARNAGWPVHGLDSQRGVAREFLAATTKSRSRSGATGSNSYILLEPGLYQAPDKRFFIFYLDGRQEKRCYVDEQRAMQIAKRIDDGEDFEAARLATKPKPKPTSTDALHAEREKLVVRLAEIDKLLAEAVKAG